MGHERAGSGEVEDLLARAAHDLQAPLRAIAGMVDLLARRYEGELDAEADEIIDLVRDGCAQMGSLLERLLDLGRAGEGPLEREEVDLAAVADRVLAALAADVAAAAVVVRVADLPVVRADPVLVHQVLLNLVGNAVAFGPPGPGAVVDVAAGRVGGAWRLTVSDAGPGIPPEDRERVFHPFAQLAPRGRGGGTGLGLAIAERAVARHGGTIGVEHRPTGGSTFWFTLPD